MLNSVQLKVIAAKHAKDNNVVDQYFDELFEYYTQNNQMPYGVAKAKTGDPFQWIADQLDMLITPQKSLFTN
jgi:hypothetical protein